VCCVVAGYGARPVLREAAILVARGEVVLVQDANGAGKTTLLATIAGVVRQRAGTISLSGQDVGTLAVHRRAAAGIAYVPEGERIFRHRTVMENVPVGTPPLGLSRRERAALCHEVLARFSVLASRAGDRAGDLSGGRGRAVSCAR
jgi:ABC-type branched-subunit amino acid transport system ATPase component